MVVKGVGMEAMRRVVNDLKPASKFAITPLIADIGVVPRSSAASVANQSRITPILFVEYGFIIILFLL
jgi:hypothetical protein